MDIDKVISASEARRIAIDKNKEAKELAEAAVQNILTIVDSEVRSTVQKGELQVTIPLIEIQRLVGINIEASKMATARLGSALAKLGYEFSSFTNHFATVTITWARSL